MINLIGFAVLTLTLIISGYYYNHRGKLYAKDKIKKIDTPKGFLLFYPYLRLSTLVFGTLSYFWNSTFLLKIYHSDSAILIGSVITLVSLVSFVNSKKALGRAYSPCFDSYLPNQVVSNGPYRFIRHPIYASNICLLTGLFISTGSLWLGFNAVIAAIFGWISSAKEEKALMNSFPLYVEYAQKTKKFIPYIY